jgi:hypothetical protein
LFHNSFLFVLALVVVVVVKCEQVIIINELTETYGVVITA